VKEMEAKKFYFIEVNPQPCSSEDADKHLRGFAEAFIDKAHVDRWIHIIFEKQKKAENELRKFERHLDSRYCTMLNSADTFPVSLSEEYGTKLGIYFDGSEPPCKITAPEAGSLVAERSTDAIFSMIPGKLAIFFFHEGWSWKCER
jgi:hypothetical protein